MRGSFNKQTKLYISSSFSKLFATFKNQKSGEGGYALAILSSSALVNGSSFTNNSARESSISRTSLGGGAIYVKGLSIYMVEENAKLQFVHIDNCTLNANMGKYGGGLFFYGPNSVTVSRSFFLSNYASMHGGGVYVTGSGQMKLVSSFEPNKIPKATSPINPL